MVQSAQHLVVCLVEDDAVLRKALAWLIRSVGLETVEFDSALNYLSEEACHRPGCVVTDMRLPHMSGMELVERIMKSECPPPVLVLTGYADVPMAVRAMRTGAFDFFEKPVNEQLFLERVQAAVKLAQKNLALHGERLAAREVVARLSSRETQILDLLVNGHTSKRIARDLAISVKTVETHRSNIFRKLETDNIPGLIRLMQLAGGQHS